MSDQSHSRHLRKGRYSGSGQVYLVTTTTHQRAPVFADWRLGRLLALELKLVQDQGFARSLAWVVMPDHLHWLLEVHNDSLSQIVRRVKSRSAITLNKSCSRQGSLWQDGFHDKAVRREEDLVDFARYIVLNPVRAGLVSSVREYPLWDAVWL